MVTNVEVTSAMLVGVGRAGIVESVSEEDGMGRTGGETTVEVSVVEEGLPEGTAGVGDVMVVEAFPDVAEIEIVDGMLIIVVDGVTVVVIVVVTLLMPEGTLVGGDSVEIVVELIDVTLFVTAGGLGRIGGLCPSIVVTVVEAVTVVDTVTVTAPPSALSLKARERLHSLCGDSISIFQTPVVIREYSILLRTQVSSRILARHVEYPYHVDTCCTPTRDVLIWEQLYSWCCASCKIGSTARSLQFPVVLSPVTRTFFTGTR